MTMIMVMILMMVIMMMMMMMMMLLTSRTDGGLARAKDLGNLVVFSISLDRDQILPISCSLLAEQLILCSAIRNVPSSYNETQIRIEIDH